MSYKTKTRQRDLVNANIQKITSVRAELPIDIVTHKWNNTKARLNNRAGACNYKRSQGLIVDEIAHTMNCSMKIGVMQILGVYRCILL